jgi:hypothetical protein
MMRHAPIVVVLLVLSVSGAEAQLGAPNPATPDQSQGLPFGSTPHFLNNPHPGLPWGDASRGPQDFGAVVRQWVVPDRTVTLDVVVPQPGSLPPTLERVTVVIPGYQVTETTRGYVLPARWTVVPGGVTGYQWQLLPGSFELRR